MPYLSALNFYNLFDFLAFFVIAGLFINMFSRAFPNIETKSNYLLLQSKILNVRSENIGQHLDSN